MMQGWMVPVTDRARPLARVCRTCERRDPFLSRIANADAGVHVAPTNRWQETTIESCDHPDHEASANTPPSVRYPGSAPDPRQGRTGRTITDGYLILSGDGLLGAGESLDSARKDVRRRLNEVGVTLTWETVHERRTYPCTGAAVVAAWQLLEGRGYPRRLTRQRCSNGENLVFQTGQVCPECSGADERTGGPKSDCDTCGSRRFIVTRVAATPKNDVALPIGIGWDPAIDPDAVVGVEPDNIGEPQYPPCADCGSAINDAEGEYGPWTRQCAGCHALYAEAADGA